MFLENILELALRGEPKEPFYMVGRMDGQSVILKAQDRMKVFLKVQAGIITAAQGAQE